MTIYQPPDIGEPPVPPQYPGLYAPPPPKGHGGRNAIIIAATVVMLGLVAAVVVLSMKSTNSNQPKANPSTAQPTSVSATTSTAASLTWTEWHAQVDGHLTALSNDLDPVMQDLSADNLAALQSDAARLMTDVHVLQADPPAPNPAADREWQAALGDEESAGQNLINGNIDIATQFLDSASGHLTNFKTMAQ